VSGAPGGEDWRPTAELPTLRLRARLLAELRRFFEARGVLEVETPVLGATTATAPHLESLQAAGPDGRPAGWLQTSPEYAMKRLLAAHGAPIYQVARAFRAGERGSRHNPEFTLVEWYRPGMALEALMDEVVALVRALLGERRAPRRHRYGALLAGRAGVDAFTSPTEALAEAAGSLGIVLHGGLDRDGLLDLLWSHGV
jgi:lysyl-tRNA synthetase class 2